MEDIDVCIRAITCMLPTEPCKERKARSIRLFNFRNPRTGSVSPEITTQVSKTPHLVRLALFAVSYYEGPYESF